MTSSEEDKGPPPGEPEPVDAKDEEPIPNGTANAASASAVEPFTAQADDGDASKPAPPESLTEPPPVPVAHPPEIDLAIAQESESNAVPDGLPQDTHLAAATMAQDMFAPQHAMPPHISLMMALAQMSASQISPPPTVTPAQVSLPSALHGHADGSGVSNGHQAGAGSALGRDPGLESFARIEFADSVFQMTTYAVIIGRDQRALEQARRDERRAQEYQRRVDENAALGLPPPSPPSYDRGKFSKSYVSEEGGMLGPESDGDDKPRPAKKRKTSTGRSVSFTPQNAEFVPQVHQQQLQQQGPDKNSNLISNRQYVSHTPGAAAVDLASLRPSPYHVPFIGIHSPGPNMASRTKAISRDHLKIQFNQESGVFEAIPLHKNGFFCDDVHYRDAKVVLKCGDRLQIKDVDFVFVINGVQPGRTGAEEYFDEEETSSKRYSEGGKEMSFEFESSHGGEIRETSEEESEVEAEGSGDGSEDEEDADEVMETIEEDTEERPVKPEPEPEQELLPPAPPRKRGPGRPPKNGIRSKREERLLKKQAQELAKKTLPQLPPGEPPVKRKVGRPRKHPLPENAGEKVEKRKYKPRKPKNAEGGEGSDGEKTVKEKRREKPKTPPLELKMEEFTEEQLQKPNKNYGVLIDEVLTEAPPDGLTLKQIYKRIQKRYPYYYFVVDTKGWESSVRHNLIGNDAFKKNDETHLWCRVPGIELDAGKKRKAVSPDPNRAPLHGTSQSYAPHHIQRPPMYRQGDHMGMRNQAQGAGSIPPGGHNIPTNGLPYPTQPHPLFKTAAARPGSQAQPGRPPHSGVVGQAAAAGQLAANNAAPGGTSRPYQHGASAMPYSSPFTSTRPPAPPPPGVNRMQPGATAAAGAPQGGALHPQGQGFGNGPNGLPLPGANPAGLTAGAAAAAARQPQSLGTNGAAGLPLKPAIDPDAATYIANFKAQVVEQLQKRTPKAELIALSAINRGVGLATQSLVPELDSMENIVLGIFQQSTKARFPAPAAAAAAAGGAQSPAGSSPTPQVQILHPALLQTLLRFKASMVENLKAKLGEQKADALLLSAIDRVLGFSDKCTAQSGDEAERKEFESAELVLMPPIREKVNEFQRLLSAR